MKKNSILKLSKTRQITIKRMIIKYFREECN